MLLVIALELASTASMQCVLPWVLYFYLFFAGGKVIVVHSKADWDQQQSEATNSGKAVSI